MASHTFLDRALTLLANGYEIIPVRAGEKRPGIDDWQNVQPDERMVRAWANGDFADGNIGIRTTHNPAVDIDVLDAPMAEKMQAWVLSEFGDDAMVRVGRQPKRMLVFYTREPFRKMYADWRSPDGVKHRVEVLGQGQQFVAYGTHPDTKRPFEWHTLDEPLDTPFDLLPELSAENAQRIIAKFGEFAKAAGWTLVTDNTGQSLVTVGQTDDDALLNVKPRLKITRDEVVDALQYVDGSEDYDRWIMVGMALHHQTRGHPEGLALWEEWSSQAPNYDSKACEKRWNSSFKDAPSHHRATTFASVLKIAHERKKAEQQHEFDRLLNVLRNTTDEREIFGPLAKEFAAAITEDFQLDLVAKRMQERVFELTDARPRIETCRKALQAKKPDLSKRKAPSWCDGWVYVTASDTFYNVDRKLQVTSSGFNAMYDREVLTDEEKAMGVAMPASRASSLALNVYGIATIEHTVYLPGMDKLLEINGRQVVNTYDETSTPEAKAPETAEEHRAIQLVEEHFDILLEDEVERAVVLDYLAYTVQNPTDKIVWGVLMQGAEGAGKTFIQRMMSRVLGEPNVGTIAASDLQEKYTGWAEGTKMSFIEEIRLHGQNRYEILDKLKPYVSNEEVPIRKMNTDSYRIPNVTNYVLFTNHWDALPLGRMDRRYFVVGTAFQTKEQLDEWAQQRPDYFVDLFTSTMRHGGVLRWWLLNRELSPHFKPKRPALETYAKTRMRNESEGNADEHDALSDILETSNDVELSNLLVNADKLRAAMDMGGGPGAPQSRAFASMMTKAGFHLIGRFRLDAASNPARYYTRQPHKFKRNQELATIREIVQSANDPFA